MYMQIEAIMEIIKKNTIENGKKKNKFTKYIKRIIKKENDQQ